jgi:glycosyltransferase 2 family protein
LKKILLNILQYAVFIGLGIVLLYLTLKGTDLNKTKKILLTANYLWIVIALFFGYIAVFIRAYRWNLLIEPLGYKPKFMNTYHSLMIGYTANYALPRIGEVVRCGTLNRLEKIPADILIGTVIAERAFDLICLIFLTILTVLLKFKFFGIFFKEKVFDIMQQKISSTFDFSFLIWASILTFIIIAICTVYVFRERIKKIVLVRKIGSIGKGVLKGAKTVLKLKRKGAFLLYTFLMWFLYYLMTYIVFFALPTTSNLTPVDGLFILILGSYGMAAPVQGGMGAFHAMIVLGLTGLYMVPKEPSVAFAVLLHEPQVIGIVLAGATSMLILFFRKKNKPNHIST